MNWIDILLAALIAAAMFFAVRKTIRDRKKGGCGCGCAGCTRACPSKLLEQQKEDKV